MSIPAPSAPHPIDDVALRVTMPLPLGIDHVHMYLVRGESGGLILVDTGLGLPGAPEFWRTVRRQVHEDVTAIVITHAHPDHSGGASTAANVFDAPVYQGRLDWALCQAAWDAGAPERLAAHIKRHGMPDKTIAATRRDHLGLARSVQWQGERVLLDDGDDLDGWRVHRLPGHADGHIALLRDGILASGDVLLDPITPHISLAPPGRSLDPLADYLHSLSMVSDLDIRLALPGHHDVLKEPKARAKALQMHHEDRLKVAQGAVGGRTCTAYDASLVLFPSDLTPTLRRFALLETLAHLEHLVNRSELRRVEDDGGAVRFSGK
jgi:glyoxylase-like metal-dependent hydrolase (beta-lactamase superfamily II)